MRYLTQLNTFFHGKEQKDLKKSCGFQKKFPYSQA
jgi:hypothetical protein